MTDVLAADRDLAKAEAELRAANWELQLNLLQATVDMAGIADPTPVTDVLGAGLSLYRGDPLGAAASMASIIPYVGDAIGKTAKGRKLLKKIAESRKRVAGLAAKTKRLQAASTKAKAAVAAVRDRVKRVAKARALQACSKARPCVQLKQGEKGGWTSELNGPLKADTDYVVNGRYTYRTDAQGRVDEVRGELKLNTADRNGYQQSKAGHEDGIKDGVDGDEGGHMIAAIFDGAGEQINYHAMSGTLNKGAWKSMEGEWARALKNGKSVEVKINAVFEGDSKRPDAFLVEYLVDGKPFTRMFPNE